MSKTYDIINYGKQYKGDFVGVLSNTVEEIVIPSEIDGVTVPLRADAFKNNANLKKIDFNQCVAVPSYCCYECANLENVDLGLVLSIGTYAFFDATKAVFSGSIDGILNIPDYAFCHTGKNAATGFVYKPASAAVIGQYAFRFSHLTELEGSFTVGNYGCANLSYLTKAHFALSGTIGNYAFYQATNVSDFLWDPESAPTSIGTYAFDHFGYDRSNPTSNVFKWDLRNCKFTSIPSYCWGYNRASLFLLSGKVTSISSYAFAYGSDITLYLNSLPTLSSASAFQSTTNLSVILNYELDDSALKAMTNWTTYASYVKSGITGYVGELAPYTESTGVALTWYSDPAMTTQVTEAVDADAIYYASKGVQREVWCVNSYLDNASLTISDGTTIYDKFIPVGTTVTITPAPTDPDKSIIFAFTVDGVDYASAGSATVVADHDIDISVVYWDGINAPFHPVLDQNSLATIKLASKLNKVPSSWKVGDEITVKYDGVNYKCRLVDKTGKFTRVADGSTAYLSFEFENLLPDNTQLHSSPESKVANFTLLSRLNTGDLWNKLDTELQEVLEEVNVKVMSEGSGGILVDLPFKVFLAREHDLVSTRVYSAPAEWDAIDQDQYYILHNSDSARIKTKLAAPDVGVAYWGMSPYYGFSSYAVGISGSGASVMWYSVTYSGAVAPRFAL